MQASNAGEDADRSRVRRSRSPDAAAMPLAGDYDVRVVYTEPEFQRRTPCAPAEYSFTYLGIAARSPEEAVDAALQDFRETARLSRVSWRRRVERVNVQPSRRSVWNPASGGR